MIQGGTTFAAPPLHTADFNRLAYNPAVTYTAPKKADGLPLTNIGTDVNGNYAYDAVRWASPSVDRDPFAAYESATDVRPMWAAPPSGTISASRSRVQLYCNTDWPILVNDPRRDRWRDRARRRRSQWPVPGHQGSLVPHQRHQVRCFRVVGRTAGHRRDGLQLSLAIVVRRHRCAVLLSAAWHQGPLVRHDVALLAAQRHDHRLHTAARRPAAAPRDPAPRRVATGRRCNAIPRSPAATTTRLRARPTRRPSTACRNVGGSDGNTPGTGAIPECLPCTCLSDYRPPGQTCSATGAVCTGATGVRPVTDLECPDQPVRPSCTGVPIYGVRQPAPPARRSCGTRWPAYTGHRPLADACNHADSRCRRPGHGWRTPARPAGTTTTATRWADWPACSSTTLRRPPTFRVKAREQDCSIPATTSSCPAVNTTVQIPAPLLRDRLRPVLRRPHRHRRRAVEAASARATARPTTTSPALQGSQVRPVPAGRSVPDQYPALPWEQQFRVERHRVSKGPAHQSVQSGLARWHYARPGQFRVDQLRELVRVLLDAPQRRQDHVGDGVLVPHATSRPGTRSSIAWASTTWARSRGLRWRRNARSSGSTSPIGTSRHSATQLQWYTKLFGVAVSTYKTPTLDAMLRIGNLFETGGAAGLPAAINPLPAGASDPIAKKPDVTLITLPEQLSHPVHRR